MRKKVLLNIAAFFISISCIFLFTVLSCMIPHNLIHGNAIESAKQLEDTLIKNRKTHSLINKFEEHGDMRNYAMLYSTDSSQPVKSAVEMNYYSKCTFVQNCWRYLTDKKGEIVSYGRYWQGQSVTLHYLTILFSANTLLVISTVIFVILFLFTVYKLFKKDKVLSVIFVLSSISINLPFTTRSFQFVPIMYIMLISTLITIRMHEKKSNHFEMFFLLLGVFTCFFDFLTAETLSVSTPLFIYTYLELKNNEKVSIKKILIYALMWFIGYAGAFLIKWILVYLFQGKAGLNLVVSSIFGHGLKISFLELVIRSVGNNFSLLMPFFFTSNGAFFALFIFGLCVIYTLTKNRQYLPLLLICLIPILRFSIIKEHSMSLNYFTYRALFCVVMFMLLTIYKVIYKAIAK